MPLIRKHMAIAMAIEPTETEELIQSQIASPDIPNTSKTLLK